MAPTVQFGEASGKQGIWGRVTSTIDWCEDNYTTTPIVAEFWNTTSNLAFVIPSLRAAVHAYRRGFRSRFILAHLSLAIVGIGSALFHATLRYSMQLLDEIPMLYLQAVLLYSVMELTPLGANRRLAAIMFSVATTLSFIYFMVRTPSFFFVAFGILTISLLVLSIRAVQQKPIISKTFAFVAFGIYSLGVIFWTVDNTYCHSLQEVRNHLTLPIHPLTQFHAWWHVFAACGGYFVVLFLLNAQLTISGVPSILCWKRGFLPVLFDRPLTSAHSKSNQY